MALVLADLSAALRPSPCPDAPGFAKASGAFPGAWKELAAARPHALDPWLRRRLDRLTAQETDVAELVRRGALLHTDIRSHNLLLTPRRGRRCPRLGLDLHPRALAGPGAVRLTVNAEGGADAETLVRDHPLSRDIDPSWIDAVLLAAVANYWWLSRLPEPPSLPDRRAHQRAYADAALRRVQCRAAG